MSIKISESSTIELDSLWVLKKFWKSTIVKVKDGSILNETRKTNVEDKAKNQF